MKKRFLAGLATGLMMLGVAGVANANIIDSTYGAGVGSFELGSFVAIGPGNSSYMTVAPGDSTTITGWMVGGPGDGVDWATSFYGADTGIYALDLQHTLGSSIATVIPTVAGGLYEISFGAASVVGYDNTGVVSAGSLINQAFASVFSNDFATQSFTPFSFLFTATGTTTTVQFMSTGTSVYGPVIDRAVSSLKCNGTG